MRILFFAFTFVICNSFSQECDDFYSHKDQINLHVNSDFKSVVSKFNLTIPFKKILKKCNIHKYNITFYESVIDAKLDTNRLKKPRTYYTSISKKIFVRLDNTELGNIKILELNLDIK